MLAGRVLVGMAAVGQALVPPTSLRSVKSSLLSRPAKSSDRVDEFTIDGADGKTTYLSTKEKERMFVDAIQSYYFSGRQLLNDTQFDQLKEDLAWEGSNYAAISRDETKFLAAMAAYSKGEPMMPDAEFDELKKSLKDSGSIIAVAQEPRCMLDTGVCSVTFTEDVYRKLALYVPGAFIGITAWTGITYEILSFTRSYNPLIVLLIGSPFIASVSQWLTEKVLFVDPLIATGPCPQCGVNQRIFFGDILGVEGAQETLDTQCSNCKTQLTVTKENLRVSTEQTLAA